MWRAPIETKVAARPDVDSLVVELDFYLACLDEEMYHAFTHPAIGLPYTNECDLQVAAPQRDMAHELLSQPSLMTALTGTHEMDGRVRRLQQAFEGNLQSGGDGLQRVESRVPEP